MLTGNLGRGCSLDYFYNFYVGLNIFKIKKKEKGAHTSFSSELGTKMQ